MSDTKLQVHTIGCLPMIFIVFLILKLTNVIAWSWWWVCSPLIILAGWYFLIYVIIGIFLGVLIALYKRI